MKYTIFLLLIGVLTFSYTEAHGQIAGAEITFEKTVHNYGTISKGADGTCTFRFKNTGNAPLLISEVSSSCGCTVPAWPKTPIMPGKSDEIKVVYDTKKTGEINKQITVLSNANTSLVMLVITGEVVSK